MADKVSEEYGAAAGSPPKKKAILALIALYLLAYIALLGTRPLFLPDEYRYAEGAREMLASGDWVAPRLAGIPYFEKPPMGYWLGALALRLCGENNFAARLPAAAGAGLAGLLVAALARRARLGWPAALCAAGILLTSLEFYLGGTFDTPDMPFSLFVTATIIIFFFAYTEPMPRARMLYLSLCGASCGLAFLTKGFLAVALPCAAVAPFLWWQKFPEGIAWRAKSLMRAAGAAAAELLRLAPIPLAAALIVALPWSIAIHRRAPDFWGYFFWEEHVRRAFGGARAQHAQPVWFYLPILLAGMLPWSLLLPAALQGLRRETLRRPIVRLAICGSLFPLLLLSLSRGKLPSYVLPIFPMLAILLSCALAGNRRTGALSAGAICSAVLACAAAAALLGAQLSGWPRRLCEEGEAWKPAAVAAAFMIWAAAAWIAARRGTSWMSWYLAAPLALFLAGPMAVPRSVLDHKAPGELLRRNAARIEPDASIMASVPEIYAASWHWRRADVRVWGHPGELEYGLHDIGGGPVTLEQLRQAQAPMAHIVLLLSYSRYAKLRGSLPPCEYMDREGDFILLQYGPETESARRTP